MATGGLDSNGVWRYGADDPASPFPDLLNLAAASTSTRVGQLQAAVTGITTTRDTAWAFYTPALTAVTTNPTGYNAAGRWGRQGRLVVVTFQIVGAPSFTPGNGIYGISLPVPAVNTGYTSGSARGYDASTGAAHLGLRLAVASGTTFGVQYTSSFGGALGNVSNALPWVWAPNDILDGFLLYEAASA